MKYDKATQELRVINKIEKNYILWCLSNKEIVMPIYNHIYETEKKLQFCEEDLSKEKQRDYKVIEIINN
jgi:hypothetical protein